MPEFFQNPAAIPSLIAFLAGFVIAILIMMIRLGALKSILAERERSAERIITNLQANEDAFRSEIAQLRMTEGKLLKSQSELETRLENQHQRNEETLQLLDTVEMRFTDTFKALSMDALKRSQQQFIQLAKSSFQTEQKEAKGELENRNLHTARKLETFEASEQSLPPKQPSEVSETGDTPTDESFDGFEGFGLEVPIKEAPVEDKSAKAESAANDFRAALDD